MNSFYQSYIELNASHGMILSFIKFALLATTGEMIGQRIRSGRFYYRGFGLIPRALVWGLLGLTIKAAFMIFATGTPVFLQYLGIDEAASALAKPLCPLKILVSFSISLALNLIFAPVMMTAHKITDSHIEMTGGTLQGFLKPVKIRQIIENLNWGVMWGFVFKKTIPLFWIPAHTITFLLPSHFQVLFAALLGIVLGVILAIAAVMSRESTEKDS